MATVKVSHNVSESALERIEQVVERAMNYNPNWNGVDIKIERDDFTCVDCRDEVAGAQLLAEVNRAIGTRD
jgi:hypothetical protein